MPRLSRRHLLKKIAGTAVAFGGGLVAGYGLLKQRMRRYPVIPGKYGQEGTRLIRPPGALGEAAFLAGCIRCYRCQDACEPGAIQFFTEAHGKHYHTPYIDPSVKACTLCMSCTQVCPTGVLQRMQQRQKSKVDMATIELREDLCLSHQAKRIRNEQAMLMALGRPATEATAGLRRRGPCGECYMFCPLRRRAIKLEPGSFLAPIAFEDACVGCGMCEEICRVMVRGEPAIRVVPKRGMV